jgi:hypothetical protein
LLTEGKDYYATIYAAEIINTLTNLLFMFLAAKGIRNCIKHGHDTVFLVAFIGYLLVGSGSFLFHATLKCTQDPLELRCKICKAIVGLSAIVSEHEQCVCTRAAHFRAYSLSPIENTD